MNYENYRPDWNKPTKFTAENYGTKISVEVDRSDLDIDEVMDAFQTLLIGMGYHQDSFKNWILNRASEYQEEENEKWDDDDDFKDLRHNIPTVNEEEEDEFFGKWDEERMNIIGQNGNEGLHYRATQEDEDEFDDYGQRVHPTFEWCDTPEDDEEIKPLFDGDEFKLNENLKAANERYKKEVKKMNAKQKRQSKK